MRDRGLHLVDQERDGGFPHRLDWLANSGQRRVGAVQPAGVVEPDHRDVARHGEARPAHRTDGAECQHVAAADEGSDALSQDARGGRLTAFKREQRVLHGRDRQADPGGVGDEGRHLAPGRHVVVRAEDHADPLVPEGQQMIEGLARRGQVVGRHAREVQPVDRRVDEHDGDSALAQQVIVLVRGGKLLVVASGEHHAGRVLLQEHVHILGLR
jgi:hypothetical protein